MARLFPVAFIVVFGMLFRPALAEPPPSAWSTREQPIQVRNFDIGGQQASEHSDQRTGARIIAGRSLMPNGMFGLGFFGQKDAGASPGRVTGRELTIPKQRRAAVGFSLKF